MKQKILFLFLFGIFLLGLRSQTAVSAKVNPEESLVLGWVGNMWPAGGSSNSVSSGTPFDLYVQVWKNGVTNAAGQGANISCTLYWAEVAFFGDTWFNITSTAMNYSSDIGNNDEYTTSITPPAGLYEFTAYCTDTTDATDMWQGSGNGQLTVTGSGGGGTQPVGVNGFWLDQDTVAWNTGYGPAGYSYELHYNLSTTVTVPSTAGSGILLSYDSVLNAASYPKSPNVNGYKGMKINAADWPLIPSILTGDMAIAVFDGGGNLVESTRLQIQGVLDDLYSFSGDLGVVYNSGIPSLYLWAPTAKSVTLHRYTDELTTTMSISSSMVMSGTSGVWAITGTPAWDKEYYLFDVEVWVAETGQIEQNLVSDPYSLALSTDGLRSQFLDLYNDPTLKPAGWDSVIKPAVGAYEDIIVYEVHIRDFSINDGTVAPADQGKYTAFNYDGTGMPLSNGMNHLQNLAAAGMTHIHLLPTFDIASVIENPALRQEPNEALMGTFARDSSNQQAELAANRATDGFNWGYDPFHYGAPEGSYATSQGETAVIEFREMVQSLNENDLRVVMDVVYNHTSANGQSYDKSVLDKIVPGYYHRYDNSGAQHTSSCCADTATEYDMMEKLMVDTVLLWAKAYKVDGFRFDLMNLHTVQNVINVRSAVDSLTTGVDGVDGLDIYIYGEGWDFGSAQSKGLNYANQWNSAGTGVGTFNDKIRDAAHGGYSADPLNIRTQGFINGLSYDWNGFFYTNRNQSDLRLKQDQLRISLAGQLQSYNLVDRFDAVQSGSTLGGYTLDPQEAIHYVSKHDNETLYDQNVFKAPWGEGGTPFTSMADRVRIQNMGLSLPALAQGIPFFQMGSEMLRSKSLDRNSYDSGDWYNKVDFTYMDNNFGKGLPPAWDNSTRWGIMGPLLANTALDPTNADILNSVAHLQEMLQIRQGSKLFRLETAADISSRLQFHNTGSTQLDGLIVMSISDAVEPDLDSNHEYIIVLFNANKVAQNFTVTELIGLPIALHPVQLSSNDPVVQTASFNVSNGTFTIPARTTAVFVSSIAPPPPEPVSAITWVGTMFPAGGSSTHRVVGDASGLTVYAQVYKAGVTDNAGQGGGIQCYVHTGEYGTVWSAIGMSYNVDIGGNDEYMATIPTGSLIPGSYGFTVYCTDDGDASRRYRENNPYLVDYDGGDGVLSVSPAGMANETDVFVHLFEWKWSDIEQECPFLATKGYDAIQVSPPMEHIIPFAPDYPWWVRYQPVSYSLGNSRSGSLAEFQAMVTVCTGLGVEVYVDAVINHMTGLDPDTATAVGTDGTIYKHYDYPGSYDTADFHYCGTNFGAGAAQHNINDYGSRFEVQTCELLSLADLNTGDTVVQATIAAYLQNLLSMGVTGFRIDASKHMFSRDIQSIVASLTGNPYVFQEVIDLSNPAEPIKSYEYFINGDVTEFNYSQIMANSFTDNVGAGCPGPNLASLVNLGTGIMDPAFAVVFVDNHDNQRGHGPGGACIVDHMDGQVYNLANIFMLAHPYGYPKVMSSYAWDGVNDNAGPPGVAGVTADVYSGGNPTGCNGTDWICEHRRTEIANMVAFRSVTAGEVVSGWWDNGGNQIAFGRNGKGYVAINREGGALNRTFATGMGAGDYCDVTKGELTAGGTACTGPVITVDGAGNTTQNIAAMDAFAIHIDAMIAACATPADVLDLTITGAGMFVTLNWTNGDASQYEVHRSTIPYIIPVGNGPTVVNEPVSGPYADNGISSYGDPINNYYYYLLPENGCGTWANQSNHVGEFDFLIVPGS